MKLKKEELLESFSSSLDNALSIYNAAKKIVDDRFDDFVCAINTLKHGSGRSYNALVVKSRSLPFKDKLPDEIVFLEGNLSEISTLIEVDDDFVLNCSELIEQISKVVKI